MNHHVWVTPYREDEKYAAGDFPNQRGGGDGLPTWTEADRPIANADVVLWDTFGHTHIPRPEGYPVMPTTYIGFVLKPNGFLMRILQMMFPRWRPRPNIAKIPSVENVYVSVGLPGNLYQGEY